ncbi:hypothetical protein BSM4216_2230 [Bacillus smithii]|nr:hypothetical protein BSM4216_2230 [Bacillus smithii]
MLYERFLAWEKLRERLSVNGRKERMKSERKEVSMPSSFSI